MPNFDTLNDLVKSFQKETKTTEKKPDTKTQISFVFPILGEANNIGMYSPNARTDARHSKHEGVDLQAPRGTKIISIAPGVVSTVASDSVGGNNIVIQHSDGFKSYYAHMDYISDAAIKSYQNKTPITNEVIGAVGNTGNAKNTSPHLHLQVWRNGSLIDPGTVINIPKPNLEAMKHYDTSKDQTSTNFSLKDALNKKSKIAYIKSLLEMYK